MSKIKKPGNPSEIPKPDRDPETRPGIPEKTGIAGRRTGDSTSKRTRRTLPCRDSGTGNKPDPAPKDIRISGISALPYNIAKKIKKIK